MATLSQREPSPIPTGRLWAGVVLAPAAWCVAELLGYYLVSRACDRGAASTVAHAGMTQDAVAIGLGVVAVVGLVIAAGNWQRVRKRSTPNPAAAWGRAHFMALAGVVASALFVLGIVLFALPPLLVNACDQVR
jgi:hypothetical protein